MSSRPKRKSKAAVIPVVKTPGNVKIYEIEIGGGEFTRLDRDAVLASAGDRHSKTQVEKVRKASDQAKDQVFNAGAIIPPVNFDTIAEFGRLNTWHRRCCSMKAGIITQLGFNDEDAPQAFLDWSKKCNEEGEALLDLLNKFQYDYEQFGNAYLEIVPTLKEGGVAEVYHAPAHSVRVLADEKGVAYGFEQMRSSKTAYFWKHGIDRTKFAGVKWPGGEPKNSMIHLHNYTSASDYYGEPDWITALTTMGLDLSALKFNTKAFENEMVISFAIVVNGGALGTEGITAVKNFLKSNFQGVSNTRRVLLLEASDPSVQIKIEKISMDIKDSSYRYLRADNRDEVIAAHGVPPRLLGIMNAAQLGGTGEGSQQLRTFNQIEIMPRKRRLASLVQTWLVSAFSPDKKYEFKFTQLDDTVESEDAEYFAQLLAVNPDIFTIEEIREELGWKAKKPTTAAPKPIAAVPLADGAPPVADQPIVDVVADTALNGAQVASLLEIVLAVISGTLPKLTAQALITAAFPAIDAAKVKAILNPVEEGSGSPPTSPIPQKPEEIVKGLKKLRKMLNDIREGIRNA